MVVRTEKKTVEGDACHSFSIEEVGDGLTSPDRSLANGEMDKEIGICDCFTMSAVFGIL